MQNKRSIRGLSKRGRIDFEMRENQLCYFLGVRGFSARCISEETELSAGQIYNRLKKQECKLRDVRNGETSFITTIIAEFKIKKRKDRKK